MALRTARLFVLSDTFNVEAFWYGLGQDFLSRFDVFGLYQQIDPSH
jgi:hypothetical protein